MSDREFFLWIAGTLGFYVSLAIALAL